MDSVPNVYPAAKGNVRELLEKYHPQRRDIYLVVRIMNMAKLIIWIPVTHIYGIHPSTRPGSIDSLHS